jgi:hypothetical protein
MSSKDTLNKAYGGIPREVGLNFEIDWITFRGIRYYYLILLRKFTR